MTNPDDGPPPESDTQTPVPSVLSLWTRVLGQLHLWIWPMLALPALIVLGMWTYRVSTTREKRQVEKNLQGILQADLTALRIWLKHQENNATAIAEDEEVKALVSKLVTRSARKDPSGEPSPSAELKALRDRMQRPLKTHGYLGFLVVNVDWTVIAASWDDPLTKPAPGPELGWLDMGFAGNATVSRPFPSQYPIPDKKGVVRKKVPTMLVVAPVHQGDKVIALLALRTRPEEGFTHILTAGRFGESGETYAFDKKGLLLSQSRFDDQLKQIGLLPDRPDARSVLNLRIADPEVDMTQGEQPPRDREEQQLTRMATLATGGNGGSNAEGYRDYRGVPVVGAWAWLPEYGFGVATEADVAEVYGPKRSQRQFLWGLYAVVVVCCIGLCIQTMRLGWAKDQVQERQHTPVPEQKAEGAHPKNTSKKARRK